MWPFWVLLLKHLYTKKRQFARNLQECLGPLAVFLFIHLLSDAGTQNKNEQVHYTEPFKFDSMPRICVLYTPETEFTNQLMDQVGAKLNLKRLDHLPSFKERGYFPFSNASLSSILEYSKHMNPSDAIVIFEFIRANNESPAVLSLTTPTFLEADMELSDTGTWPKKLNYTIRMKYSFMTFQYEPKEHPVMGSHEFFGREYEPFMRLQWAIDTSYLYLMSGANVGQTLSLQEFPYVTDHVNNNVVITCRLAALLLPLPIVLIFTFFTLRLFVEKNSGIHELVKMAGVSWEAMTLSRVVEMLPNLLIYALGGAIFFKVTGLIPNTSGVFIFLNLALHFLSVITMAVATVYIIDITQHIELTTNALGFASCMTILTEFVTDRALGTLCCILPHVPFLKFWSLLASREIIDESITFSNMWSHDAPWSVRPLISVGEAYVIMLFQIVFFGMLAWYLSRVRPGKFGQALPWTFPLSKEYGSMTPKVELNGVTYGLVPSFPPETEQQQQYFEEAPAGVPVGIQITDVYKVFGKEQVLHGVNMAVYKGEITVLIGPNGAGKSTLISIISGQISATSGRVLVEGRDTFTQAKEVRKLIGLCPQQNIFVLGLTVQEHVVFFAMLKGQSYSKSKDTAKNLLSKLRLSDKANSRIAVLSGSMKRRVQLCCAIAGGASVLILDEPTSGLDVKTRRVIWNLLLSLRGDHTILLTTHSMEEADALGDRIVALHHGVVRCHATTMFLKRAIGTGYRLSFTTIGAPKESAITSTITKIVPNATVRDQGPNAISYNLPAKDTSRFPQLFQALEERRWKLGINTIGVGKSTLDEVFIKLCSDVKPSLTEETDTAIEIVDISRLFEPVHEKVSGPKLWVRQFEVLWMRQLRFIFFPLITFVCIVFIVILLLGLLVALSNNHPFGSISRAKPANADVALNLDLYSASSQRRALVDVDADTLAALRTGYDKVHFEEVTDIPETILRTSRLNIREYNEYLVGIELNDTHAKALFTTTVRHAAPVALNLLSNAIAARMLGGADGHTITIRNHPLQGAAASIQFQKEQLKIHNFAAGLAMMVMVYLTSCASLPSLERVSGTRHAHVLAGVPLALHWAATLLAQLLGAVVLCIVPVVTFSSIFEADHTIDQPGFIAAMCMLLILGMLAFMSVVYLVSMGVDQSVASASLPFVAVFFTVTPLLAEMSDIFAKVLYIAYILTPPHALTVGLLKAALIAQTNAYCNLNRARCPALYGPGMFEASKCCDSPVGSEPWSYWAVSDKAAGREMLLLAAQAAVYFALLYFMDRGVLGQMYARCIRAPRPPLRYADSVVSDEAAYVEEVIQLPKEQITDAILVHNLQKNYYPGSKAKNPFFPVRDISFSVKKGECFGLLGVNGAGKSSTFKMLTAETAPNGGDIFANGHHLSSSTAYMKSFSYCPQFFGLDEFLTGRQNLMLVLTLRGLQGTDVKTVADSWIEEVGLSRYADKPVSSYSGGCARRLAVAAALCQGARTALLDEPTAGVDPTARRLMHQALLRAKKTNSLIIASHSLDEMEALCDRSAIMIRGELCALGSAASLKENYATGHSVVFKLASAEDVPDGVTKLDKFKGDMHARFDCTLQDEHQTMLKYHINDTLRYSRLFGRIEMLKQQHPGLLDDYTVTETTLEEVFFAVAEEARSTDENMAYESMIQQSRKFD